MEMRSIVIKTAVILLHHTAYYRRDCYARGLREVGYTTTFNRDHKPRRDDLLLIWNRNPGQDRVAKEFEKVGATVVVTENGYIGKTKALALNHHSGAGKWFVGTKRRDLDIDISPWRSDGEHILVLPQRSIGEPGLAMPRGWQQSIKARLAKVTDRSVIIREHPGKDKTQEPTLERQLKGAWCAVTWASGAGIKAICAGVPVFHDLAQWIGAKAARKNFDNLEDCYTGCRDEMLHRLSWAQWTMDEIISGEAFNYLLNEGC